MSASQWRITSLLALAVAAALACLGLYLWLLTDWKAIGGFWLAVAVILGSLAGYLFLYLKGFFRIQVLARFIATNGPEQAPSPPPSETVLENDTPPAAADTAAAFLSRGTVTEARVRMDEWQIRLLEVYVTSEIGLGDRKVQLIVDVTNVGQEKSTFTGYTIQLVDERQRSHGFDLSGSCDGAEMHGLEMAAFVEPGDTVRTCVTYIVPVDAHSFTTEPMSIVNVWEGGLAFQVP
jgi:hypothetical protein